LYEDVHDFVNTGHFYHGKKFWKEREEGGFIGVGGQWACAWVYNLI